MDVAEKLINLDPIYQGKINENGFQVAALNASKSQLFLPSIDFNFGRYKDLILVTNQEATFLRSSLDISYNLFNFGSDYNSFQASKYILSSYHAEIKSIKIEREKVIFKLLFDYISLKKQIEIFEQLKDLKLKVLKLSQKNYKLGRISKMELLKLDLDIANTNSQIIDRKQQLLDIYDQINAFNSVKINITSMHFPWGDIVSEKLIQNVANFDINDLSVPSLEKLRFEKSALEKDYISEKRKHFGRINLNYSRNKIM